MKRQHIICVKFAVCVDYDCRAEMKTGIDGDVWDINGPHFAEISVRYEDKIKYVEGIIYI